MEKQTKAVNPKAILSWRSNRFNLEFKEAYYIFPAD